MKRMLFFITAVILLLSACAPTKITIDNIPPNAIYNPESDIAIKLGDKKEDVDKLLGEPTEPTEGSYFYDKSLGIMYVEDRVVYITPFHEKWVAYNGINMGMTKDEIAELIDETSIDKIFKTYFTSDMKKASFENYDYSVSVHFYTEGLTEIFIIAKEFAEGVE